MDYYSNYVESIYCNTVVNQMQWVKTVLHSVLLLYKVYFSLQQFLKLTYDSVALKTLLKKLVDSGKTDLS